MDITQAILHCRPGALWTLNGDEYSGLVWLDTVQEKPTEVELDAAWAELSAQMSPEQRRASMAATFDALPLSVQAAFYSARIAAEAAMARNRFDIAAAIISAQQVPPDLEVTKTAILADLQGAL